MSKLHFTEMQFGDSFLEILPQELRSIRSCDATVHREALCMLGKPDFTVICQAKEGFNIQLNKEIGFIGAKILHLLHDMKEVTIAQVNETIGFTIPAIKRSVKNLIQSELIAENEIDTYQMTNAKRLIESEVWSFELKLHNVKRALEQASIFKWHADKVVVVTPKESKKNFAKYESYFMARGIGLATFCLEEKLFEMYLEPKKTTVSISHKVYVIANCYTKTPEPKGKITWNNHAAVGAKATHC